MGLQKSKYPDFNEVIGMAGKLFKDVQKSVCEIAEDYKIKRKEAAAQESAENAAKAAAAAAAASVQPDVKTTTPEQAASAEVKVDVKAEKPNAASTSEPELVKEEPVVVTEEIKEVKIEKTDDKVQ
jgi:hypothetical protein